MNFILFFFQLISRKYSYIIDGIYNKTDSFPSTSFFHDAQFPVLSSTVPESQSSPTVVNATSSSVQLVVSLPQFLNGDFDHFDVYRSALSQAPTLAYSGVNQLILLIGLAPFTTYAIWVKSFNSQFPSTPATSGNTTTTTLQAGIAMINLDSSTKNSQFALRNLARARFQPTCHENVILSLFLCSSVLVAGTSTPGS